MNKSTANATPALRLVAWEMTRSCMLHCRHCRASASKGPYADELTASECEKVLNSIVAFVKPIIILTGGEPLLRTDIFEIAAMGRDRGCRMVMAPCGQMLDPNTCAKIKESGIQRISLSIDAASAPAHDALRGKKGAFDTLIAGIANVRASGLEFQVNTTVTKRNIHELPAILDLSISLGAVSFHPFLLVPTGRGKDMVSEAISPEEYETTLTWMYEQRTRVPISVKPTCAPHYHRIFREREHAEGRPVRPETHGLDAMTKGCLGGQGFAFISHTGKVQICGFLESEAGDLRSENYDFGKIWQDSELLCSVRDADSYHGKCGRCEYRTVCGGCRARAFAATGDFLGEEPFCIYQPADKTEHSNHETASKPQRIHAR
jgi:AdoMet-dependent heme synthase